jgi:hypothetical protein
MPCGSGVRAAAGTTALLDVADGTLDVITLPVLLVGEPDSRFPEKIDPLLSMVRYLHSSIWLRLPDSGKPNVASDRRLTVVNGRQRF